MAPSSGGPATAYSAEDDLDAVGAVRMFAATISTLDPTTLDPAGEGWRQLTGRGASGQSATEAIILDNGLVRLVLDRNDSASVGEGAGMALYAHDGSAWRYLGGNNTDRWTSPRVAEVLQNDAGTVRVRVDYASVAGGAVATRDMEVRRGLPVLMVGGERTGLAGDSWNLALAGASGSQQTALVSGDSAQAVDIHGKQSFFSNTFDGSDNWLVIPRPDVGLDVVVAGAKTAATGLFVRTSTIEPHGGRGAFWIGAVPRTYTLGDGGGADQGNGDGQLREAEDNFTQVAGTWAKATGVTGASSSATLRNAAPSADDEASWDMDFPAAGQYYVGVACTSVVSGSPGQLEVGVGGVDSGTPLDVPTAGLDTLAGQNLYGPFTVAAGTRTVDCRVSILGGMTSLDLDFIAIYPAQAVAGTPEDQVFPKDLANGLLWGLKWT